ncbi:type VII secretion protein EccB [Mycolicibacterium phlei]
MSEPTRLQSSGHRFLMRRMTHALVRGDVGMHDDPLRAQSAALAAGCVLAAIGLAAGAVLAYLAPRGSLGDAPIVMVRDSGALYVRVGDALHPVPNLASARLVAGSPDIPRLVDASALDAVARGPAVGIPGAPATLPAPLSADESGWHVCEDADSTTTVLAGAVAEQSPSTALVTAYGESAASTYLLYDGRRARVDLRNPAVVRALRLDNVAPRPVSRALLDALPEAPPIAPPAIAGLGAAGPAPLHGLSVGTVIRVPRAATTDHYVVLAGGLQRIGEVAADLIRFSRADGRREILTVEPAAVGALLAVEDLPVAHFPDRAGVSADPVLCVHWRWSGGAADTAVTTGDVLPGTRPAAPLAQADGAGRNVDAVALPAGRSAYVHAAGVTGDGARTGARYLLTADGVVFGVRDDDAATRLGLPTDAVPAPWPLLAHLPRGPELSVQAAATAEPPPGP